jgi:ribosome-binding protein aMBF1 (putative translation factor)
MNPKEIKSKFEELLRLSPEEEIEHNSQMLAFYFLSIIDEEMERQNMSKKKLAELVGTSQAFITQLFMGDRKPNWTMLAKMQKVLGLEFVVSTKTAMNTLMVEAISAAHKLWVSEGSYEINTERKLSGPFEIEKNNHCVPLAS